MTLQCDQQKHRLVYPNRRSLCDAPYPIWGRDQQEAFPGVSEVFFADRSNPITPRLLADITGSLRAKGASQRSVDRITNLCRKGCLAIACAREGDATRIIAIAVFPSEVTAGTRARAYRLCSRSTSGWKLPAIFQTFCHSLLERLSPPCGQTT